MSRGFSGGKQVINFSNTRNSGRVCLFLTTENEQLFILKTIMENKAGWKSSLLRHSKLIGSVSGEIVPGHNPASYAGYGAKSKARGGTNRSHTSNIVPMSQWYGHPRVLGFPILKPLVIWASPVILALTLTQITKVFFFFATFFIELKTSFTMLLKNKH